MKTYVFALVATWLALASPAVAQHDIMTRSVEGPQAPFARQMTGHAFTATPPTLPSNFRLQTEGNFQAQPLNKERFYYMKSFLARDPTFHTMEHESPGGLTNPGIGREMGRSWDELYTPFNTGWKTWEPTKFTPPPLAENRPNEKMWTTLSGSIGQRIPNGPSWINIDISQDPIEPVQGFQTPIKQSIDPATP